MDYFDNDEIREFLLLYKIVSPSEELVNKTKRLMRAEMARTFPDSAWQGSWLFALLSISLMMSMCTFYMLTVGTILTFTLPSYMLEFLRHSIFAFTGVGACFLTGIFMVFFFKQFEYSHTNM